MNAKFEYDTHFVDRYDLGVVLPTIISGTLVILYYIPNILRMYNTTRLDGDAGMMYAFVKFLKAMRLL